MARPGVVVQDWNGIARPVDACRDQSRFGMDRTGFAGADSTGQ